MKEYLNHYIKAAAMTVKIMLGIIGIMGMIALVSFIVTVNQSEPECRIDTGVTFELHKTAGRPDGAQRYMLYKVSSAGFELIDHNIWTSDLEFGKEYRIIIVEPE